jgi:hypothetical protein
MKGVVSTEDGFGIEVHNDFVAIAQMQLADFIAVGVDGGSRENELRARHAIRRARLRRNWDRGDTAGSPQYLAAQPSLFPSATRAHSDNLGIFFSGVEHFRQFPIC